MIFLDGLELTDFELPEKIDQGGQQELVIHKTIGGRREIHAMGPDDAEISWSGRLWGETAQLRALRFDLMRRSGKQVLLEFGLRTYKGVIKSFTAQIEKPYLLTYSISYEIKEDLVGGPEGAESRTIEAETNEKLATAELAAQDELALLASVQTVRGLFSGRITPGTLLRSMSLTAIAEMQRSVGTSVLEATGSGVLAESAIASVSKPVGTLMALVPPSQATDPVEQGILAVPLAFAGVEAGRDPGAMSSGLTAVAAAAATAYASHLVVQNLTGVQANLAAVPP
jgi:hypothetical protein